MTVRHEPGVGSAVTVPTRLGAVIVPAHQEADRIGTCLESLADGWRPGELDVLVVVNGSSDGTADVARKTASRLRIEVQVVELTQPGKAAALRAGEAATRSPRLYLDADVRCSASAARSLLRAVRKGDVDVAVPTRVLDLSGCSLPARLYHRAWADLPWVREQLAGRGAYCLSDLACRLLADCPDVLADDRLATTLVGRDRARVVPEPAVVAPASTLREVLTVRQRIYAGNEALGSALQVPVHDRSFSGRLAAVLLVPGAPSRWPGRLVWAAVTVSAKLLAMRGAPVRWRAPRIGRAA